MWSWQSIRPGSTVFPDTSMISASAGQSLWLRVVTAAIRSSRSTIVAPSTGAAPVPSSSLPPLRIFIASLPLTAGADLSRGYGRKHRVRETRQSACHLPGASMSRAAAIAAAEAYFDEGRFAADLARRVAIPTESQVEERAPVLRAYLADEIGPSLARLGYDSELVPNPVRGGPMLIAERREEGAETTVFGHGHGDV